MSKESGLRLFEGVLFIFWVKVVLLSAFPSEQQLSAPHSVSVGRATNTNVCSSIFVSILIDSYSFPSLTHLKCQPSQLMAKPVP